MAGAWVAPETSPTLVGRLRAVPADESAWELQEQWRETLKFLLQQK
jgi:hypothetical protein